MAKVGILNTEIVMLNDMLVEQAKKGKNMLEASEILEYIRKTVPRKIRESPKMYFFFGKNHQQKGDAWTRCYWCGRILTDGKSRLNGCGLSDLKKHGPVPGRNTKDIKKLYGEYVRYAKKTGFGALPIQEWIPESDFSKKEYATMIDQIVDIRATEI